MTCRLRENMIDPCTGYIGSPEVSHIQVDPGSALSIMPCRVMQHLGIPTHWLSATQTTIYGFNANSTYPMGKIKLKCQIENLRFKVTCYVIDADTSYNLLLWWPWIHRNSIVPSILHQIVKYVAGDGKVQTLVAKRHPFKGVGTTSQTPSRTRILWRQMRIPSQRN